MYRTSGRGRYSATYDEDTQDEYKGQTHAAVQLRLVFVRKVYMVMASMLAITVAECALVRVPAVLYGVLRLLNGSWFVRMCTWSLGVSPLILLRVLRHKRHCYPANLYLLGAFTVLVGGSVALATAFTDTLVLLAAASITLGVFSAVTLYAMTATKDFRYLYPTMGGILLGMAVAAFWSRFLPLNETLYCLAGAIVFAMYLMIDTQIVAQRLPVDEWVLGAIEVYLDIANLFIYILGLLSDRENKKDKKREEEEEEESDD
ncbi:Bax inhibitor 1-related protein [Kipferlia bialata]|uniref:Bax inhibitor 1-related protein n=1 Tax=Kipferlia bialata TaxID=797122 RepID=A0A9K3CPW3_9EUKA|nr:Bax inhibitor 1-related protein [Kipferlia bialata]|eukprot:g938.t1